MKCHFKILEEIYDIQNRVMEINLETDVDKYKILLQKLGKLYYEASLSINTVNDNFRNI